MGREAKMKRLLMLSALLLITIGLNGCFLFLGAEPEVEYVVSHNGLGGEGMTVKYLDENMELQEVFVGSTYFQTSFSVPATEDTVTFVQGRGEDLAGGPYTLSVRIYVDGSLREIGSDNDNVPEADAVYLVEP